MDITKIVDILKKGGVVVIPTDTTYGIVCDATNEEAVRKIYKLKGRDYHKPMIVLMNSIKMLEEYTSLVNPLERELINTYLPGELTIILNKNNLIPNIVTSGKDTLGIRIPNNKDLIDIINKLGTPIVATSANLSNQKEITNINMLDNSIKSNVDYIYDIGYVNKGASTIIKVDQNTINILREGSLSEKIRKEYGDIVK